MKELRTPFISTHFARVLLFSLLATLALLALPALSLAQDTGYISGTVIDKTGAAIAGAEITLKNTAGSLTRTTVSNGDGAYVIPGLPGDTYDMTVTAKGFQKFSAKKIVLSVGEKARIDVSMNVGAVTEEVVVTGESIAQVETTSSEIGSTISGKQVQQLELNGRQFTHLAALSPGVIDQTNGATGTDDGVVGVTNIQFSINGGRYEYNNWELDGGDNMDNGSNATLNVYPNIEAIAEFKVLASNYGAQYGRNGSGTVEVETKSGGSAFHGSAFYYNRNEFFKARSWAEGEDPTAPKAPYKKHDFGYTFGGPVYIPNHYNSDKKKTFFFWSQEWRRENVSTTILQNVPSDAERGGNFADLCPDPGGSMADCPSGPGVSAAHTVVPTSVGTALLAIIPKANTNNGFPAVTETVSSKTTWREELIRVDHNLNTNNRLTFRYIHDTWQTVWPNALWGNGTSFQNITTNFVGPGTSFVARLNSNLSPTLLNEFVASYTGDHIFLTTGGPVDIPSGFLCASPGATGCMGSIFNNGFGGKLPAISVGNNNAYGGTFTSDTGYFPWHNANPTYTYRDNMTKILGNHTLTFGAYAVFAQKNEANSPYIQGILNFDTSDSTVSSGNAFADLLLGNIASYQQTTKETQYYNRYKIVEPYFQDDWRLTKRLTLNLGLRVSMFGTYREKFKQAFNFNPDLFVKANQPGFNPDGSLNTGSGSGNPLNGFVQCGGKGGTFPLVPGSAFPSVSVGSSSNAGCLSGHLFNPAPRVGFAYDPKGDGKMAIRGGYGIFFEHTNGNEGNTESLEGSAPLVLTATQSNVIGYQNIGAGGGTIPFFPLSVLSIPNKAVWPYMQQWNLNIQKELPYHLVFSAAYVGSKGTHLTLLSNANQLHRVSSNPYSPGEPIITVDNAGDFGLPPGAANTVCPDSSYAGGSVNGVPVSGQVAVNLAVACGTVISNAFARTEFPGYNNINTLRDAANSIYHSLQTGLQRTVGDLTLSVAYTYSHSIDDSSSRSDSAFVDAYNIAANRASSNFDLRHNFTLSYVYALPLFKGSGGLAHSLLGGWQVSGITVAQTGLPFSVTNGLSSFGDNAGVANGAGTGSRPDQISNPRSGFTSNQDPGLRGPLLFNPAAFAAPTGLTFGNVGRNTLYLPGRLNFDFGVFKRFPIRESTGFEFRWETFNLFNHTQYNGVDSSFGPDTFGHLNSTHDPRRMQFGLRFYF
ncbi:MAG TPA: carboxypeptidase-like regulatory domain-containing protein [Candidatus Acidoferrum sp.]|nr:carboxypeptidase-like regulatory domain-containing protein [Candidatus Acidoferrum sp.]